MLEAAPTYVNFTGVNGLELSISLPRTQLFDYTLMFWMRSTQSYAELSTDPNIKDTKAYLFKLVNGVGCYITRTETVENQKIVTGGPWLRCESGDTNGTGDIEVDLAELPDIQAWMHLTFSAIYNPASASSSVKSQSYLRIDISSFHKTWQGGYRPIKGNKVYYGCAGLLSTDLGFPGNYRQFWITVGYI